MVDLSALVCAHSTAIVTRPRSALPGAGRLGRRSDVVADQSSIPMRGSCDSTLGKMARVRLFAAARDAAGTARDDLPGDTVADVLSAANQRYGDSFAAVLATSRIWVNGEPAQSDDHVGAADELAVLPPVSGG